MSLRKQGANKGAVSAFLISTPESGVDSIAVTYALMDPVMTVARPASAFITATAAGLAENLTARGRTSAPLVPNLSCPVDSCCDGVDCDPEKHRRHHSLFEKTKAGLGFAFMDLWDDMAGWFFLGLILAGLITGFIPTEWMSRYLGGGLTAMLVMLLVGTPLYICATASTPIAAALILKGVSPGAALVFLLAGPATNITSLTVLAGTLGKRSTAIYLLAIAVFSVACGVLLDWMIGYFGWTVKALAQSPKEIIPEWLEHLGAFFLGGLFILSLIRKRRLKREDQQEGTLPDTPPRPHENTSGRGVISEKKCGCDAPT